MPVQTCEISDNRHNPNGKVPFSCVPACNNYLTRYQKQFFGRLRSSQPCGSRLKGKCQRVLFSLQKCETCMTKKKFKNIVSVLF